ncbi:MAG: twin-arginine translocase subunit TatC [Candidatus Theseobacter exili]|nr:twin-arginine translocase subunit TatC [Candidatus Theseobacter exili]
METIKNNISDSDDMLQEKPFLDHLEDLRKTLLSIVFSLFAALIFSFIFAPKILKVLTRPLNRIIINAGSQESVRPMLQSLKPAGAFLVALKISFFAGLMLSLPLCLYFLSRFVFPGLTKKERNLLIKSLLLGGLLFFSGVLFAYFVVFPLGLLFLWNYHTTMGIVPMWTIEHFISFELVFFLAFGLVFETPVLVLLLVQFGILSQKLLRQNRRYAIVFIFILAAVLTPPDPVTQICMAIPMFGLFEFSVWIAGFVEKRKIN